MHFNHLIRQTHRWLSVAFTAIVASLFLAFAQGVDTEWVYYLPLPPLALMTLSGLYLFALPYLRRGRRGSGQ